MSWLKPTEREKWGAPLALSDLQRHLGLPALDARSQYLYGRALPRNVLAPRFVPDRPPINYWMSPVELSQFGFVPGQLILGKFGDRFLGHIDDRPIVTIAGARAGKTSTVLEPNLYLFPGSCLLMDPKGELTAKTARLRRHLGHQLFVLDPFGQSGGRGACFNALAELDPESDTIIDDVATVTQALIVDAGDTRSQHWNDSARKLLQCIILFTLTLPPHKRHLVTVRRLLSLTYSGIVRAKRPREGRGQKARRKYYADNESAIEVLLRAMAGSGNRFNGILAATATRFLDTPEGERGSIFSTASAQTDFLDSLPLRRMSMRSDFRLSALRSDKPTTIYLCLPVGRMESHFRWLRLVVQMAFTVLERMGTYPRDRTPILFLMEEFATLGHMDIMERAAAYFPGFGVKLWAILQDITQLQRYYQNSWETFLGNAGLVQCFANSDQATLQYISTRLERLITPAELRTTFSRDRLTQLLMFEGRPPAAALRLDHSDVATIRDRLSAHVRRRHFG